MLPLYFRLQFKLTFPSLSEGSLGADERPGLALLLGEPVRGGCATAGAEAMLQVRGQGGNL